MKKFKHVRDPETGRIDMVPTKPNAEWGDKADSAATAATMGRLRYGVVQGLLEEGGLATAEDLHDAALIEVTSLLAPHVDDDDLGPVAQHWTDAAALVRNGSTPLATVTFSLRLNGALSRVAINIAMDDVVLTVFGFEDGEILNDPLVYWIESGEFAMTCVDDDAVDDRMVDMSFQTLRAELTRAAVAGAAIQKAAEADGVISLAAWSTMRMLKSAA